MCPTLPLELALTDGPKGIRRNRTVPRRPSSAQKNRARTTGSLDHDDSLLRVLTDNSPDAIYVKDLESRWLMANPAVLRIVGKTEQEALGKTDLELYSDPEIGRAILENDRRIILSGNAETFEEAADTPEGRRLFLSTTAPWRDTRGRIIGIIGISRDITVRKRSEQALLESEQRYAIIHDHAPFAIVLIKHPEGIITDVNAAWEKLFECPRAEAIGKTTLELGLSPDPQSRSRMYTAIGENGFVRDWELVFSTRSGKRGIASFTYDLVTIGGQLFQLGTAIEITDRKNAEDALLKLNMELEQRVEDRTAELARTAEKVRAERQRLFDVLEALPVMICLLTPDYHVAFANKSFRDRFGESEGRHCYEYCYGRPAPCEFCESYEVLRSGKPHFWEVATADGSVISAHDFPFTDTDGSPLILEMDMDITQWRRSEQQLRSAHAEIAQRASQLRALAGELTLSEQRERRRMAKLLHDHLQQLLVGAKFRAAILERGGDELVRNAVAEIEKLLDDSIQASRSLTAELSPPILHDGGLAPGLEWLSRWMADKHGLFVQLEVEKDLPQIPDDVRILLFESVRELLFNVVKHAHCRSVDVTARRIGSREVILTVSDEGQGFDPSAVKKAGETGGGFGLFSIHERLGMIGGKLEIDSAPGKGSRFVLTAPVNEAPAAAAEPLPARAGGARPVQTGEMQGAAPIRILLADDHIVMREGLAQLLGQEPDVLIVGQASDGAEAVELARRLLPDVILMDMSMPNLNGVEATRIIHNENPEIRVIGLSMFEEAERAQALRDAGAVDYLSKSGPPARLIETVRARAAEARQT